MKSQKEIALDNKILSLVSGVAQKTVELLINDQEIHHLQEYANIVSIKRLGYNDHGPVHMRTVCINALTMADLLNAAGIKLNLEKEEIGTFEDSKVVLLLAGFMHDIGMSIGRERHEQMAIIMAIPILDRLLSQIYPDDFAKRVTIRSMVVECIAGHMATQHIHSLEAGIILIADGCDMEKGRARIPLLINTQSKVGDIHKYSSSSVEHVKIEKGDKRPIKLTVQMSESVGFFQVEEVLFTKINSSTIKPYIELQAFVTNGPVKHYL